jgi:hypothetical protein
MTRKLPNTNEVIAQVKAEAARRVFEKQAAAPMVVSQYKTGAAKALHKLAAVLREVDLNQVTYDEIRQFVEAVRPA